MVSSPPWFFPDPELRGSGKHLRLVRVDRWDSGVYYCSTNASSMRHNMTLVVRHPPRVTVSPRASVEQAEGHPVELTCKVGHYLLHFLIL